MSDFKIGQAVVIKETGAKGSVVDLENGAPVVDYDGASVPEMMCDDELVPDVLYNAGDTVIVTFSKPVNGVTKTEGTVLGVDGEFRTVSYVDSFGPVETTQKVGAFKPAPTSAGDGPSVVSAVA